MLDIDLSALDSKLAERVIISLPRLCCAGSDVLQNRITRREADSWFV